MTTTPTMRFKANYKYQLCESFEYVMPFMFGEFYTVPGNWVTLTRDVINFAAGYAWDGASGPTADTPNTMVPALVHDGLFQLGREGGLPNSYFHIANELFYQMLLDRGMNRIRAWYWYQAVKYGSASKWKPGNGRKVREAS